MRGPSSWTVGERELFAAFTSSRNQCQFCTTAHQAFAASCTSDDLVAAALAAPAAAPVRPQVAAVLTFLDTLAGASERITADDVLAVRAAGVDDLALEEAVRISALFHVINRVMDAAGAGPLEGRSLDLAGRMSWEGATSCRRPSAGSPVAIEPASENGTGASAGACDRQAALWNLTTPSSGPHLEQLAATSQWQ